ncbi:hypothetical protein ACCT18_01460 [Rhizobium ruizarguesonis]
MSIVHDISDEGLVRQFGDVMFELPELFEALRRFEIENRPAVTSGGFNIKGDGVSMKRGRDMLRVQIGNFGTKV